MIQLPSYVHLAVDAPICFLLHLPGGTSTQTVHRQNFIKMGVGFGLFWGLIAWVRWEVGGGGGDGGGGGVERKELRT